jgi:hypothetical protein
MLQSDASSFRPINEAEDVYHTEHYRGIHNSRPWTTVNDDISSKMRAALSSSPPIIPKRLAFYKILFVLSKFLSSW